MSKPWSQSIAVVTGAASGIGLALSRALVQRGAQVYMADIDLPKLAKAAATLGPQARTAALDVRDAQAVNAYTEQVWQEAGGIDYFFNNAGIAFAGETVDFTAEHFDRIIDVNIRGVTNGIAAVYPRMARQGHGHIINTASLAGLTPTPLMIPYTLSKHAIVGLSTSLRIEAQVYGVRVSTICPAAVETPLLDAAVPPDLAAGTWQPNVRRFLVDAAGPAYPTERLADAVLRGVEKNQSLIIVPLRARLIAWLNRWFPSLVMAVLAKAARDERHKSRSQAGSS